MADSANLESRRDLFTQLASLPAPQLEAVIFALNLPAGILPSGTAPQGERVATLLQWVESPTGCGLAALVELAKEYRAEWETIDAEAVEIATQPKLIIQTMQRADRQFFAERLPELEAAPADTLLKMVQIPEGSFGMGSVEDELDRYDDEGPQHQVTVPAFFMAMTPITQSQWRAVAQLPTLNRTLKPEPSHFKGDHHPVEQVSWPEAMEFCGRLSEYSGRDYRLPTEAEWEYACRAGTTSPFHCGEAITTDLANYRGTDKKEHGWSGSYGRGPKGEYRETTTEVGIFPANGFGLYDMHGNVWEWCLDHWHDNYEGASPSDGSAWIEAEAEEIRSRVLRGGSWNNSPRPCRSACRNLSSPDDRDDHCGFRVVCAAARTLF